MDDIYILRHETKMRCYFDPPITMPSQGKNKSKNSDDSINKSVNPLTNLLLSSTHTMIPQYTKISLWNKKTGSFYYRNPILGNYFTALVVEWGDPEPNTEIYNIIKHIGDSKAFLTVL
jgi:hypothetical protein